MFIFRHHTASDVIDLDPASGHWHSVKDDDRPKISALSPAYRDSYPIRGSYTVEAEKLYSMYWDDEQTFVFRSPDGLIFELFRKEPSGKVVALRIGTRLTIEPSKYRDGRLRQGYSDVKLHEGTGATLYTLTYNHEPYLRMYGGDFTAAAMVQGLGDWDFFVGLKEALETLSALADSGRVEMAYNEDGSANIGGVRLPESEIVFAETGNVCPREGTWAAIDDLRASTTVKRGDKMPGRHGAAVQWVWVRPASADVQR